MKALILLVALFISSVAVADGHIWRDCNQPANAQACKAEFVKAEAARKAAQNALSGAELNRFVCESVTGSVCGGGAGGAGA